MAIAVSKLQEACNNLALEARSLHLNTVISLIDAAQLSPLSFYRDFVSANRPVKILNAINHWPALEKWSQDYLAEKMGEQCVTVTFTPDGYADAITDGLFMLPAERAMKFSEFLEELNQADERYVCYVQKQNSNMTDEFKDLLTDVDKEIGWATEAIGTSPDAVNFWMGDQRAVTSLHKDHYENLYGVVRGEKIFTLIPPTDQTFVPYEKVPIGQYKLLEDKTFSIETNSTQKRHSWIGIDPLLPDLLKHPEYVNARPLTVTVKRGELLYLPSLWFHHVQQSHGCIAVNYWYDMQYDLKYNYYEFVSELKTLMMKEDQQC